MASVVEGLARLNLYRLSMLSILWALPRLSIRCHIAGVLIIYDILQWITTWLAGRKQKVVIDGVCSDPGRVV